MSNKSENIIALPKGGGAINGIGEKFSPDLHTGTGNFTIPIAVPAGRNGFQPQINLVYSTGNGNSPFGLGWSLSIPGISRKTAKGVPLYDELKDVFILSGAEDLVAIETTGTTTRYRPRTEGLFAQIFFHRDAVNSYWEVNSVDGLVSLYGTAGALGNDPAAIADPADRTKVFAWNLTQTRDTFGNHIEYAYSRDTGVDGPHTWDQLYLDTIRYVDYDNAGGNPSYLVTIEFIYVLRPDFHSGYKSGFEIRTRKRCTDIRIHINDGQDQIVKTYHLEYLDERPELAALLPINGVSLLSRITITGHDGNTTESLPPVEFRYSSFNPDKRDFFPLTGADLPGRSLTDPNLDLVDLFGNGLPDFVELSGTCRYWRNLGNGAFDLPRFMQEAPAGFSLGNAGVQLIDANGNGRPDLLVTKNPLSGYFPLRFDGHWDNRSFQRYRQAPDFELKDPEVKLIDLDGDGVTDAIRSGSRMECFFNDPVEGWNNTRHVERQALDSFPNVNFSDPRVKWGDFTGDGMQTIALVNNGNVEYWPHMGRGKWGRKIHMENSPKFPYGYDPKRILIGDVDGDGLADIVYVDDTKVTLWMNQSGNSWSDAFTITGTPPVSDVDAIRLVDLLGTGIAGVLWSSDANALSRNQLFFLDFTGGIKPYLLTEMDNHIGASTRVTYAPSVRFYLEDQKRLSTRWKTTLPFPVHVVSKVEMIDLFSGGKLNTQYRYHNGCWDGGEREFRGFGMAEQLDTEFFEENDDIEQKHFSTPTLNKTWFHLGPVGDEFGDWQELDWSDAYWPGDPQLLGHTQTINQFLQNWQSTPDGRRIKRDALRCLCGSVLRTELFALDASATQERPFTVTESCYNLQEVEASAGGTASRKRVFFPHAVSKRTTQWERGNDPMTQFTFTRYTDENDGDRFDAFGRPLAQTQIACPRNWRQLNDRPAEPYLATRTCTAYGLPLSTTDYIHNRIAKNTTYEVIQTLGKQVEELAGLKDASADLSVIAQTINLYDGEAFAGLPLQQVGKFGAVTRMETLQLTDKVLQDAYGAQRPPYIKALGNPNWTSEYPVEFRTLLPVRAGYLFRAGGAGSSLVEGYFSITERRRYDFQTNPSGAGRGVVLEMLDPLHDDAIDPFAHRTLVEYDRFHFLPVKVTDAAALSTTGDYDYRVLQPKLVTDANDNKTRFTFSPLGMLRSSFILGKSNTEGDQQAPGVQMEYGFLAVENSLPGNPQPIFVRTVRRVHHDTEADVPLPQRDETITSVEYSDGFGRLLQTRTQGEDVRFGNEHFGGGEAVLPARQSDGAGSDLEGRINTNTQMPNVVVSGWQIYNNKGQVVEKYEPFFSEGWDYIQPADNKTGRKVTMFYDPRGHTIRTLNPDGSEQRVIYGVPGTIALPDLEQPDVFEPTPWEAFTYDANDNAGRTHPGISASYKHHWNTPASILVDALGRTIKAVGRNRGAPANHGDPLPPIQELIISTTYDIRGNIVSVKDAMGRSAFNYVYDYANHPLRIESIDAGIRTSVYDASGGITEQRDSKGALALHGYDNLNRSIRLWARDGEGQKLTLRQRLEYGDASSPTQPSAERVANRAENRLGRLFKNFDEAGLVTFGSYDFKGNPLEKTRQVINDAAILKVFDGPPADWRIRAFRTEWTNPNSTPLAPTAYVSSTTYDALNRPKLITYPEDVENKRRMLRPHYNRSGALEKVTLENAGAGGGIATDTFVERIAYNAKGQRVFIAYGNGIMTRYAYDPDTFRLLRLRTERYHESSDLTYQHTGTVFQEFAYEHDLGGNILKILDCTPDCGILNTALGRDALHQVFTYDAIYRLASATGRECDQAPAFPWDDTPRCTDLTKTRGYTEFYRYDMAGNISQLKHMADAGGFVRDFKLAAGNNRLSTMSLSNNDFGYEYDANGNMTGEASSRHFEWDYADRMRVYRTQAGTSEPSVYAHYFYDAGGQRVKKLVRKQGGQVEVTIYIDGIFKFQRVIRGGITEENNTLHVMDSQSRIAVVRVGNPFANDITPSVKYQLGNHLASSNVVMDSTGNLINREEYTPYGETSFGSFARKRYRFLGKERDEENGLSYHEARYYIPWMGRWLSADPVGMIDGINLYVYARHNPISQIDPKGTQTCNPDISSCDSLRENPGSANQSSSKIQRTDESEQMNEENRKTISNIAATPLQKSNYNLSTEFGKAYKAYQSDLATPVQTESPPTLGIGEALKYSWQHGSTKDKAVLSLTGVGSVAGFIPYWGDYISLGTSVGVLALDPSLSNLGDVGLNAVGAALPFVPALGTFRKADKIGEAANLIKSAEKTHITYVLTDAPGNVRYVGRAQGFGSPEKVMYDRLTKGHKIFAAHPNLVAEVLAEHRTLEASKGAESVYHDYFLAKGHDLLNSPLSPPGGLSTAARRAKTRENISVFFLEW